MVAENPKAQVSKNQQLPCNRSKADYAFNAQVSVDKAHVVIDGATNPTEASLGFYCNFAGKLLARDAF